MPTYEYVCAACGHRLEAVQKFTDDALTKCPSCKKAKLRKVYGAVGIAFKGSGFYKTDSRSASSSATPAASTSDASSDSSPSKESGTKSDSAPAKSENGSKSESGSSGSARPEKAKPAASTAS